MNVRTALRVTAFAALAAITNWPGPPMTHAADAAEPPAAAADQPPAADPSPRLHKRDAAGEAIEGTAGAEPPTADEQAETDHPRLRGIGKQRYPREEPDVGFGGPSRTRDTGKEATP